MKIIISDLSKTNIINKSKFIGIIKKVMTKDEALNTLNLVKKDYPDATHICYAYIIDNNEKYSDDKEPEGTAGIPILNVLKKMNLNYVIAIVIRYFGGVKLGSNNLVRAYGNTISELLNNNIKEIEKGFLIYIKEDYYNLDYINYLLKDDIIIQKKYQNKIEIMAIVKKKTLEKLSNVSYQIIEEKII